MSVVGQLLGFGVGNKINGCSFFDNWDKPYLYTPGLSIFYSVLNIIKNQECKVRLAYAVWLTSTASGGVGGWFAGRAIGKAIRKKLGL